MYISSISGCDQLAGYSEKEKKMIINLSVEIHIFRKIHVKLSLCLYIKGYRCISTSVPDILMMLHYSW